MRSRMASGGLALGLLVLMGSSLEARQRPEYPLAPLVPKGDIVAPYFDGWYANPDGTYTLSFGFMNRNTEELVEIPIGPDNFIEPAEFNGVQPTSFPPVTYGGFGGRRERGAFAVRIPAEMRGQDVVWTLRVAGQTLSVPGRVTAPAYELDYLPQAGGSLMPALRFDPAGAVSQDREGVFADPVTVSAGSPLPLTIWARDRFERRDAVPVSTTWYKHQGPGMVEFQPRTARLDADEGQDWAEGRTTAMFTEPGEYVLRVRVDNFAAGDSSFGNQCCWSNGYVRVTVTP